MNPYLLGLGLVNLLVLLALYRWVRRKVKRLDLLTGLALDCRDQCFSYRMHCRMEADAANRHANTARRWAAEARRVAEDFGVRKPEENV